MDVDWRQITTICFDADETLWKFDQVKRHALACVLEELEQRLSGVRRLLSIEKMMAIHGAVSEEMVKNDT